MQPPAPFVAAIQQVEDQWVDYNGHLNMAYYNVLFDRAGDEAFEFVGLGADYLKTANCSFFTLEAHITYLRELHAGDPVRVSQNGTSLSARVAIKERVPEGTCFLLEGTAEANANALLNGAPVSVQIEKDAAPR